MGQQMQQLGDKMPGTNLTLQQFIKKAVAAHGGLYDYSMVEYKKHSEKVKILCKVHGEFFQSPNAHLRGQTCPKCALIGRTMNNFLERAIQVHGDRYDYSISDFLNTRTKIKILCPIHGIFEQRPAAHLNGEGCRHCGLEKVSSQNTTSHEDFIKKCIAVHGAEYDYSKTKYVKGDQSVKIVCRKHGEFNQIAKNHLSGRRCRECSFEGIIESSRKKFIQESVLVHGNKYDYSKVEYKKSNKKVCILCKEHGPFFTTPNKHLSGRGCPSCVKCGFDPGKPAILYYIEIRKDNFPLLYKIGITNRTVEERYQSKRFNKGIRVLKSWEYPIGIEAKRIEHIILKKYKDYLYQGEPPLDGVGVSEIFAEDVLGLAI